MLCWEAFGDVSPLVEDDINISLSRWLNCFLLSLSVELLFRAVAISKGESAELNLFVA